jgi:hypothetical protein
VRDALHICSPHGTLRTPEGVRAELTRLLDMIAELDGAAITQTLKPIRHHIDDILLPFKQAEAIAAELRLGHCQVVGDDIVTRQQQALSGCDCHRPDA